YSFFNHLFNVDESSGDSKMKRSEQPNYDDSAVSYVQFSKEMEVFVKFKEILNIE
ncbi:hypothetical protein ALC53_01965, partial [Atta colombica]